MTKKYKIFSQQIKTFIFKKAALALAAILCISALSACGGQKENAQGNVGDSQEHYHPGAEPPGGSGIYDIFSDTEQMITVEKDDLAGTLKTVQFFHGEPVILAVDSISKEGKSVSDIYLYSQGQKARLIAGGLPSNVAQGAGFIFLDEEGGIYHINGGLLTSVNATITKYDSSGNKAYSLERNAAQLQLCSLADGKIAMLYSDSSLDRHVLELLDSATGAASEVKLKTAMEPAVYLGTDGTAPYLLDSYGVSRVDPAEGTITRQLSFSGSSYSLPDDSAPEAERISSFQIDAGGDIRILRGRMLAYGMSTALNLPIGTASLEILQRRELDDSKTFLTLRGMWQPDEWLKTRITEFNSGSRNYYVLVENPEDGTSEEDYVNRTLVELGAGKGPDILYGDIMLGTSLYSLAQKGAFEDLAPYMESSGMKREDYFPQAFCDFGSEGKIYGLLLDISVYTQTIDASLPTDKENDDIKGFDIESFLDALLALGDTAVYEKSSDSGEVLQILLQGSETLWGMIDWDKGTCRLDTPLFPKLLQAAKNLGADNKKSYTPLTEKNYIYLTFFKSAQKKTDSDKKVSGLPFDDGCHGMVRTWSSLKANANSQNKDGVWEFLNYLLSRESQEKQRLPVHRDAFAAMAKARMDEEAKYGLSIYPDPLTLEEVAELEAYLMEDTRFLPIRVQPLIDIIKAEAADYFSGTKSIAQVREVAQNRIQLYLEENH